jgi:predicted Zn-dependent peptidase
LIEKKSLKNNLKVLFQKSPGALSVSVGLWVKIGSRHENDEERGYTHFLEHMVFKGTEKRSSKMIASEIERVGGFMNAATSREYTYFYVTVMKSEVELAIDILSDMVTRPLLSENDIKNESGVVLEEMKGYEDDPEEFLHDFYYKNLMPNSSLGLDIIGNKKSISNINSVKIKKYYNKYYNPANMILSISGDFDANHIFDLSEKYLGDFEREATLIPKEPIVPKNLNKFYEKRKLEQVNFVIGSDGITKELNQNISMSLFNTIFGSSMSSRLFQKIREDKGLCYSINSFSSSYTDCGIFSISCGTSKKNFETSIESILEEIRLILENGITENELKDAKSNQKGSMSISYEQPDNKMTDISIQEIYYNTYYSLEERMKMIDNITLADINHLINYLFSKKVFHISAIGDIKEKAFLKIKNTI